MNMIQYIGIPYQIKGESFTGADCWGLCRLFGQNELNINFPKYMYSEVTYMEEAMEYIKTEKHNLGHGWTQVDIPRLGDICIFRIQGQEVHCGIHLNKSEFLHSLKGRASSIEFLEHINWSHRHVGSYRWQG